MKLIRSILTSVLVGRHSHAAAARRIHSKTFGMRRARTSGRWIAGLRGLAAVVMLSALAGCEGIGDGSTIKSLEILPGNGSTETSPSYKIYQCLRDQLVVIATFTDGTRADFSFRATWKSSDESIVRVSNNDIPTTFISGGQFTEFATVPYRPGTLIPQPDSTGETVTITAEFVGLSASLDVSVGAPTFKVSPVPSAAPQGAPPLSHVGVGTTQRFAFFAVQDGRTVLSTTLNALGTLNPILWRFVGGELQKADSTVAGDFDKYNIPDNSSPTANINALSGVVTGKAADANVREVEAATSLCFDPSDPDAASPFKPRAPARVAVFATAGDPITLAYEANFNGEGQPLNGDFISGTAELLKVTANLDTDGDGTAEQTQDISSQVAFDITHEPCTSGETNCTCDTQAVPVCTKSVFLFSGLNNQLVTFVTNDGEDALIEACFSDAADAIHTDDCDAAETTDNPEATVRRSNALTFHAVPVDLTGATGSIVVTAASPTQAALTYPGLQFNAYGTFTALPNFSFSEDGPDGDPATGIQKITRFMSWTTRPNDSTTEFSDVAFVRNNSDGFFTGIGQVTHLKDVTVNTDLDIFVTPLTPFTSVSAPTTPAASLTVTPAP